jgi:hypothetical protein
MYINRQIKAVLRIRNVLRDREKGPGERICISHLALFGYIV